MKFPILPYHADRKLCIIFGEINTIGEEKLIKGPTGNFTSRSIMIKVQDAEIFMQQTVPGYISSSEKTDRFFWVNNIKKADFEHLESGKAILIIGEFIKKPNKETEEDNWSINCKKLHYTDSSNANSFAFNFDAIDDTIEDDNEEDAFEEKEEELI